LLPTTWAEVGMVVVIVVVLVAVVVVVALVIDVLVVVVEVKVEVQVVVKSNLDYPDLDHPDFSIIRTFCLVPIWS